MKVLGIAGSGRIPKNSAVHTLVEKVLAATDCECELISFHDKHILGCLACMGCVRDNVCVVADDLAPLRRKIVEADAYVIGAPNYYDGPNALTRAFLERWFQFRHQEGDTLWGKLGVAVGVGGMTGQAPADAIETYFRYNFIETVAKITGQGAASCFSCGYGETCKVGVPYMLYGPDAKITDDMIPDVARQANVMEQAEEAGTLLGLRLREGHDRAAVAAQMQKVMMESFKESV